VPQCACASAVCLCHLLTVAVAATSSGATYPQLYTSSSTPPAAGLPLVEAYASSDASTGVLQGEAASANVAPAR
jgi:hypothetical protein